MKIKRWTRIRPVNVTAAGRGRSFFPAYWAAVIVMLLSFVHVVLDAVALDVLLSTVPILSEESEVEVAVEEHAFT